MRLIVLASASTPTVPLDARAWVLRLSGTPQPGELPPPGLLHLADEAALQVRETFPKWLWAWLSQCGALDLQIWPGPISWWWYTALSEKSPLRSPLIRQLYWLELLRRVLTVHALEIVEWYDDDPVLADVAAQVAAQCNVNFQAYLHRATDRPGRFSLLWRHLRVSVAQLVRTIALKLLGFGRLPLATPHVALYSRFPVLWERRAERWHERMFGTWPDFLMQHNHRVAYAAVCTEPVMRLWRNRRALRERCRQQNIWLLEAYTPLWKILAAQFAPAFWRRYVAWRVAQQRQPLDYAGLTLNALFWREFDRAAFDPEIAFDRTVAAAFQTVMKQWPDARAVCLPFEYQPMERAVWAGVKSTAAVAVIGLQTGLFTANQLGFAFPSEEMRVEPGDARRSPLPDIVAAYGELPYRVFADRLGEQRVCLSGAIRYEHLNQSAPFDRAAFCSAQRLSESATFILVTTSLAAEESLPLLAGAFAVAAERSNVFLLIKFHYHLPLQAEVDRLAAQHQFDRYRVFDTDLNSLMRVAFCLLVAGSSTGLEAIAAKCMPLSFRAPGEMSSNPMLDVPDAVFFWNSLGELRQALDHCLTRDAEYQQRVAAWPAALARQFYRLDDQANTRLYQFAQKQGVL